MPTIDNWRPKLRTAAAMARLCWAQLLVSCIPFARWSATLGLDSARPEQRTGALSLAKEKAADVEWAASRLPFPTKCLPRAMALSWMLRRRGIAHSLVVAVRPDQLRQSPDALHSWVEVYGEKILGDLPGPWIETLRAGS